jgi:hypothetical protein
MESVVHKYVNYFPVCNWKNQEISIRIYLVWTVFGITTTEKRAAVTESAQLLQTYNRNTATSPISYVERSPSVGLVYTVNNPLGVFRNLGHKITELYTVNNTNCNTAHYAIMSVFIQIFHSQIQILFGNSIYIGHSHILTMKNVRNVHNKSMKITIF